MKRVFFKTISLVLVIASVLSVLCSCRSGRIASHTAALNNTINPAVTPVRELHSIKREDLSFVASSGLIKLYFDKRTCSVAVLDISSGRYWTALPAFSGDTAAMLNVVLVSENGRYYLNSQDNAVAFSAYSAEFSSDGIKITYYMSDNNVTAHKSVKSLSAGDIYVSVPVEIRLVDGSMTVSILSDEIFVSDGYILESLSLMPCFGAISYTDAAAAAEAAFDPDSAVKTAEEQTTQPEDVSSVESAEKTAAAESDKETVESETAPDDTENVTETAAAKQNEDGSLYDDFLFVPDGCGAVMYTRFSDTENERVSFNVYGDEELQEGFSAKVPAFGIKKADAAFVAVIGSGAEYASVKANRGSVDIDAANKAYAEFRLTSVRSEKDKLYYSDRVNDTITVCYRFMSGSEANYISMAASCREYLIRVGQLSSRQNDSETYPVNISVIGTVDGGYSTLVSGFEETEDMLSVIKAKGINNVNLILQGFFPGGLLQDSGDKAEPMKKNGGKKALNALCEYASKQKFSVYAGLNILTASSDSEAARTLAGKPLNTSFANPLSPYIGKASYGMRLLAADKIEENVISLLNSAKSPGLSGFCINDAANYTYADRSGEGKSVSEVSAVLAENVSSFASLNGLMLNGCNFNVIREASYLLNVPFYTQYPENDAYCAVPFIPAILHSTVGYSGTPANSSELPRLEMLKCIEYGGIPYFEWVFSMKSHLYYGLNLNETVEHIVRAAKELADLNGARISGHKKLQDGVYMTEFDTGSVLYVNYNNYSVNIDKISVAPYDYIRIN